MVALWATAYKIVRRDLNLPLCAPSLFYLNSLSDEMDLDAEWSLCGRWRIKSYVETSIGHYAPNTSISGPKLVRYAR